MQGCYRSSHLSAISSNIYGEITIDKQIATCLRNVLPKIMCRCRAALCARWHGEQRLLILTLSKVATEDSSEMKIIGSPSSILSLQVKLIWEFALFVCEPRLQHITSSVHCPWNWVLCMMSVKIFIKTHTWILVALWWSAAGHYLVWHVIVFSVVCVCVSGGVYDCLV